MFKTLIIATAATVSLAVFAPVYAVGMYNSRPNGTELNGWSLNGITSNGRQFQGRSLQGSELRHTDGMRVVGVELPASH